jgi:hypothetical protein
MYTYIHTYIHTYIRIALANVPRIEGRGFESDETRFLTEECLRVLSSFFGTKLPRCTYFNVHVMIPVHRNSVARLNIYFQTKNTNLGKFWNALQWKMLSF